MRFELSYSRFTRILFAPLWMGPKRTWLDVADDTLVVHMGLWFHVAVPLASVTGVSPLGRRVLSAGVHGWRGRWLVNAASRPIVAIDIDPPAGGRMTGIPVRVRRLLVGVTEPDAFIDLLTGSSSAGAGQ